MQSLLSVLHMGRWAQSRRRGGSTGSVAALPAPVLGALGDPDLNWSWSGADPDHWDIEESADGIGGWSLTESVPGANRDSHAEASGLYYRIIGRSALNVAVTSYSNVVLQF